jgi:hypothetical protein
MYLGDASFPPGTLDEWLAAVPPCAAFDEWPSRWGLEYEEDAMPVEQSMREILEFLAEERITLVEIGRDRVRVRTLVPKDGDSWLTFRAAIASAFRGVGQLGGTAMLEAVTSDDAGHDAGFRVESSPGEHRCIPLSEREVRAARASTAGKELDAVVKRWLAEHA